MSFLVKFVFLYFKITCNNSFLILSYNQSIKIYSKGNFITKHTSKSFSSVFELMFSKVVEILKKWNIYFIVLQSNKKQFFSKTTISLLFKNFLNYKIKILKFNFKIQISHNGCRLKK
jgi:hypothetical protein